MSFELELVWTQYRKPPPPSRNRFYDTNATYTYVLFQITVEPSDVNCLSLSQALCLILNFVFQGIWLDDVMAWVEAHLEEKLASAGSIKRVQGWVRALRGIKVGGGPCGMLNRLRMLPKLLLWVISWGTLEGGWGLGSEFIDMWQREYRCTLYTP